MRQTLRNRHGLRLTVGGNPANHFHTDARVLTVHFFFQLGSGHQGCSLSSVLLESIKYMTPENNLKLKPEESSQFKHLTSSTVLETHKSVGRFFCTLFFLPQVQLFAPLMVLLKSLLYLMQEIVSFYGAAKKCWHPETRVSRLYLTL